MGVFSGCVVDAASFSSPAIVSPGAIVTLFGSKMGPLQGLAFQLQGNRLPTSLGGTRVLLNGQPVPILFSSYWQLNVILPYSLPIQTPIRFQVESNGSPGNEIGPLVSKTAGFSIFRTNDSLNRPAAALNEDGTLNSPANPARRGSRVVLYGTGGGVTVPQSEAGEVTPLELRFLASQPMVQVGTDAGRSGLFATVEYAGAAPGLVAGVVQINIKLPEIIPDIAGFPRGIVPLSVITSDYSNYSNYVTVAVEVN